MSGATQTARFAAVQVGDALPERQLTPDNVQLMLYNWDERLKIISTV